MGDYNIIRFLTGKYRTPVIENRAFMFLDLRSSVQHAEKLGNVLYSELIRDCFRELNYLVYKFEAEIYQYVGDEIVLTWKTSVAQRNYNILGIFFAFDQALQKKSKHYLNKYGIIPEFKAGCNAGEVTAAEIGIIKRDIAYHGDVINTSSRVQNMCNVLHHDLLITPSIINNEIPLNGFEIKSVGRHKLKGKGIETELFSVLLKAQNNV
jgi:adenylate cyclase